MKNGHQQIQKEECPNVEVKNTSADLMQKHTNSGELIGVRSRQDCMKTTQRTLGVYSR